MFNDIQSYYQHSLCYLFMISGFEMDFIGLVTKWI